MIFAVYKYVFEQAKPNFIQTQKYRLGARGKKFSKGTSNSTIKSHKTPLKPPNFRVQLCRATATMKCCFKLSFGSNITQQYPKEYNLQFCFSKIFFPLQIYNFLMKKRHVF
jgi:hypothetical protein